MLDKVSPTGRPLPGLPVQFFASGLWLVWTPCDTKYVNSSIVIFWIFCFLLCKSVFPQQVLHPSIQNAAMSTCDPNH